MKKSICFLFVTLLLTMCTNCTKPNDNPNSAPTEIKTLNDLNGQWDFKSLTAYGHEGDTIPCSSSSITNSLRISININSTANTCILTYNCSGVKSNYNVTYTNSDLIIGNIDDFQYNSYNKLTGILILSTHIVEIIGTDGTLYYLTLQYKP